METKEIKRVVALLLREGRSLSDIQKELQDKHEVKMTFLDLRLLAAEIEEIDWEFQAEEEAKKEQEAKEAEKKEADDELETENIDDEDDIPGKTVVELSKLARPGAAMCGHVTFASGVKADWFIDQLGRLGLEKNTGQPTPQDIQEFQIELQNALAGGGGL